MLKVESISIIHFFTPELFMEKLRANIFIIKPLRLQLSEHRILGEMSQ